MADWNVALPAEAVEGAETHVEDHNAIVDSIKEVRTNVDGIELTPGPKGDKGDKGDPGAAGKDGAAGAKGEQGEKGETGENPFTEDQVAQLLALIEEE